MLLKQLVENAGLIAVMPDVGLDVLIKSGKALTRGEIEIMEIDAASISPEDIEPLCNALPNTMIGITNINDILQAERYIKAGARYVTVSGAQEDVIDSCLKKGIDLMVICRCESELDKYIELEIPIIRCECVRITAWQEFEKMAASRGIKLVVSSPEEPVKLKRYARNPSVAALAGAWLCPEKWIAAGEYDKIAEKAADMVRDMLGFKIAHVGINAFDESEASGIAGGFSEILGMPASDGTTSFFVSSLIEVNKEPGRGEHGHIGIYTNNINRAVHHIEKRGFTIDTTPLTEGRKGPLYLHTEVGGFAMHLIQNN